MTRPGFGAFVWLVLVPPLAMALPTSSISILIAEDDEVIRSSLKRVLAVDQRFRVVAETATGRETIAACRALPPDVLLVDLNMPQTSGLETIRVVGEHCSETLIIAISGSSELRVEALEGGAAKFIQKPFSSAELKDLILSTLSDAR